MNWKANHLLAAGAVVLATSLLATACSSAPSGSAESSDSAEPASSQGAASSGTSSASTEDCVNVMDAVALTPTSTVGKGFYGETPASVDDLELSEADIEKVKAGGYKVGIAMQTMDLDWSTLQVQGLQDKLGELGIEVIGVTDPKFDPQTQISDIENLVAQGPDAIISIPTDQAVTAEAYKKIGAAGIKLILMLNVPTGLKPPVDYQAVISPDDQGNGQIAAAALSNCIPDGGTVGVVDFGVDFFTTNQRTLRVKDWFAQNRPDVTIKEVLFTDTQNVGQVAQDFLTANPDVDGLYTVWDSPGMQSIAALRSAGIKIPVVTIDLGNEAAVALAEGDYMKAIAAQDPYAQGQAEALAAANALVGNEIPAWISLPAITVTAKTVLEKYKELYRTDPPQALVDACTKSGLCE